MMSFNQISNKISDKGYRRSTAARIIYSDNGTPIKVYDFEHRRRLDVFSVYLDEFDAVLYAEFTKVNFDQQTKKFTQEVTRIDDVRMLNKILA